MATRMTDSFIISPGLFEDPRLNYPSWIISVTEWASLRNFGPVLITNLIPTDAAWNADHPAGEPRLPAPPADMAGNPNAAAIAVWKRHTEIAEKAEIISNEFKAAIIASLGPDIDRETSVGETGHITQSISEILSLVKTAYGNLTTTDIAQRKASLTINPAQSFRANMAEFRHTFTALSTVGMYTSAYDQMQALEDACAGGPTASLVLAYKNEFPLLANRSFAAMTAYIEARIPNLTATAAGYAGKVEADAPMAALVAKFAALEARIEAAAAAAVAAPNHTGQGGRGGRGGGRAQGRGRGRGRQQPAPAANPYCFVHGHAGHPGTACRTMKFDNSYTDAMKQATASSTIDGYRGAI